ncbi:MAG: hypothetical protein E2O95_04970 [Acidobacteria bacterium]|nr:MAG: hypothetical protein E2O95_04970 [Acidobacteriota bacterium]
MSVGHVARAIEESGIPTVTVVVRSFAHRATEMHLPRTLTVNHPMGRPLGPAHQADRHNAVLDAAFALLTSATESGSMAQDRAEFRS